MLPVASTQCTHALLNVAVPHSTPLPYRATTYDIPPLCCAVARVCLCNVPLPRMYCTDVRYCSVPLSNCLVLLLQLVLCHVLLLCGSTRGMAKTLVGPSRLPRLQSRHVTFHCPVPPFVLLLPASLCHSLSHCASLHCAACTPTAPSCNTCCTLTLAIPVGRGNSPSRPESCTVH
jgi:hypothetical protein